MTHTRILPIPLGGLEPSQYYTKEEIDQLIAPFITNTVDDLVNYYLKTETYTKSEVQNLVGQITAFEVVSVLPTEGIKTNVIYLLGPIGSGTDKYEEYIYSNSAWVKIGETSIDLTNYVTTTMLSAALADYTTTADLTTLLAGKQDTLTAGENITIENNVISAAGGGSKQWFGKQSEFDALTEYDADTDYFISDKIDYSEIKGAPNITNYYEKVQVDAKEAALNNKVASKVELTYMTQEEFDSITPLEGKNYMIQGDTVAMTFTFDDDTTATYYVLQDN